MAKARKKEMDADNMTQEECLDYLKTELSKAEASGEKGAVDWSLFMKLFQAIQRFGPTAMVLIQQLIEFFKTPEPPPVPTMKATHGHCDHKECCLQVLKSALCTAHYAADHYQQCCAEEEED